MKWDYEGQGLEWLGRAVLVFAAIGVVSVLGWAGWGVGQLLGVL
jgi:hypothetical protein